MDDVFLWLFQAAPAWLVLLFLVLWVVDRAITKYWPQFCEFRKERDQAEIQRERERNQRTQSRKLVEEQKKRARPVL